MNLPLEHLVGIEVASLARQRQVTHHHRASAFLDYKKASFMGLAFGVEAFNFEALDIKVEHITMVVASHP